jgi:hypothetical protein
LKLALGGGGALVRLVGSLGLGEFHGGLARAEVDSLENVLVAVYLLEVGYSMRLECK